MRRSTRLGLIAAVVLLLVLGGAYTAFWLATADRIKDGVATWAESMRPEKLDVAWQAIRVSGYPLAFRVELSAPTLKNTSTIPPVEMQAPEISGTTRPWAYRLWRIMASQGLEAIVGNPGVPLAKIRAEAAEATVFVPAEGGAQAWVGLRRATSEPGAEPENRVGAEAVDAWLTAPVKPPRGHDDRNIAIAASLQNVTLPLPPPFASPVDTSFGVTLMGVLPAAPLRQAADAWRRSGGTVEVDHVGLAWGGINMNGSGTMSLDPDLQPTAAFSGTIAGYDQLIGLLTAAGNIRPNDARIVRLALGVMAKPGADGKPAISTSFTIQNGQMYLGPARLGPVPRLNWE
jgi:hypothetical protein